MAYIGSAPTTTASRKSQTTYRYLLTAGQSVISGADLNNNTLSCDPLDTEVFMNGLKLDSTDTTITATQVSLATPGAAGDEIDVVAYRTFESADHYTKSTADTRYEPIDSAYTKAEADTRYVNTAGDSMTGNLGIGVSPTDSFGFTKALDVGSTGGAFVYVRDTDATNAIGGIGMSGTRMYISNKAAGPMTFQVNGDATTRMTIDSSGYVTKPYQPMFGAYNYSGTTTAIAGYNPILWGNVHTNVGNHFNNSTGKFTFPVSGKYVVFCNINNKASDANWSGLYMLYNTSVQLVNWSMDNAGTLHDNVILSSLVTASANDTLAFCWHNSYAAPATTAGYNMAYIYLLG